MSVDDPRLAAAQRTVAIARASANRRRPRGRTLAAWLLIVPALSLFSFSVVAGAKTGGQPAYAKAAEQLPPGKPLVVVQADKSDDNFFDRFTKAYTNKELCAVTPSQLARIGSHYHVEHTTITVNGVAVDVVTVSGEGANDHELRAYLGDPKLKCKLVRRASVFYLPFDPPQVS